MVEGLCGFVGHGDGAELSKRGSLELLKQDLDSCIAITRNLKKRCKAGKQHSCTNKSPLFDEPPEHALTLLVVRGALAAFPQTRPRYGAACAGCSSTLYSKKENLSPARDAWRWSTAVDINRNWRNRHWTWTPLDTHLMSKHSSCNQQKKTNINI